MPSKKSRGKRLTLYDKKLDRNLRRMNNEGVTNVPLIGGLGYEVCFQPPWEVNENNKIQPNKKLGEALRPLVPQVARLNDH